MSIYSVNLVGRLVLHDPAFRERLRSDPQGALRELDLAPEERAALLGGDVRRLYDMGAHEYLMMNLARFDVLGVDPKTFSERMRSPAVSG